MLPVFVIKFKHDEDLNLRTSLSTVTLEHYEKGQDLPKPTTHSKHVAFSISRISLFITELHLILDLRDLMLQSQYQSTASIFIKLQVICLTELSALLSLSTM